MKLYIMESEGMQMAPGCAAQVIEEGQLSKPLNRYTRAMRLYSDMACMVKLSKNGPEVYLPAKQAEWFVAKPDMVLSVTPQEEVSAMGSSDMLRVLADPKAAKARADELAEAQANHDAAASNAKAQRDALAAEQAALEAKQQRLAEDQAELEANEINLAKRQEDLARDEQQLAEDQKLLKAARKKFEQESAEKIKAISDGQSELNARLAEIQSMARKNNIEFDKRAKDLDARERSLKELEDDYTERMSVLEKLGQRKRA